MGQHVVGMRQVVQRKRRLHGTDSALCVLCGIDRLLDQLQRKQRLLRDLLGQRHAEGVQLGPRHDMVDHAKPVRLFSRQPVGGEQELLGLAHAQLPRVGEELGPAEREAIISTLDSEVAAEALSEIDPKMQANILENLEPEVAADIVEEMSPDQAADALGQMEDETTEEIFEEMESGEDEEVRELLEYDEDTAGGMMNTEAILMPAETTLDEALKRLRDHEDLLESTHVLFLTGTAGKVTGAVPLARLFLAEGSTPLGELAAERLIATKPTEKKNRVAELFDKYNLLALPVLALAATAGVLVTNGPASALDTSRCGDPMTYNRNACFEVRNATEGFYSVGLYDLAHGVKFVDEMKAPAALPRPKRMALGPRVLLTPTV